MCYIFRYAPDDITIFLEKKTQPQNANTRDVLPIRQYKFDHVSWNHTHAVYSIKILHIIQNNHPVATLVVLTQITSIFNN